MPRKKDRWPELCEWVRSDDQLPVREVGPWTEDKLYFWNRYIDITTSAMVGSPQWAGGLVYVDLFSGPGVCLVRDNSKRIPGSTLIAAKALKPFSRIVACELDTQLANALEMRLRRSGTTSQCHVLTGNCNDLIDRVVPLIPPRALTVAFIDPPGLDVWFTTISKLASAGRVDLLILFADAYDVVRNVDLYESQLESRLDRMLGPDSHWREKWDNLANRSGENVRKLFASIYCDQLATLEYKVFGEKTMKSARGPLYRLIYASKHERGLEFWDKVTVRDRKGQKGFDF